jgi:hypothetical protein
MRLRKTLLMGAVLGVGINAGAGAMNTCSPCPPGKYSNASTDYKCTSCPKNYFCPGSSDAVACSSGRTTNGTGKTTEADCTITCGSHSYAADNKCICDSGYNTTGNSGGATSGGAGLNCVSKCANSSFVNTGTKSCSSDPSGNGKSSLPYGSGQYCYCQQKNSCTGVTRWASTGYLKNYGGTRTVAMCQNNCSCD